MHHIHILSIDKLVRILAQTDKLNAILKSIKNDM